MATARQVSLGLITALGVYGLSQVVYNKLIRKRLPPALTEAETRAIMRGIVEELGPTVKSCSDLAKKVQEELAAGWGPVPAEPEMMRIYVYPTFRAEFLQIQDRLCAEHNVCESELEEAVEVYLTSDKELAALAQDLAKLITKMGGAPAGEGATEGGAGGGGGGGMTIVDVLNELASRILTATNDYCAAHVETHGPPTSPEASAVFTQGLTQMSEDIQKMFLGELGLTPQVWQQLLEQNAGQPEVQQAFMRMTQGIQAILAKYGLQAQ